MTSWETEKHPSTLVRYRRIEEALGSGPESQTVTEITAGVAAMDGPPCGEKTTRNALRQMERIGLVYRVTPGRQPRFGRTVLGIEREETRP